MHAAFGSQQFASAERFPSDGPTSRPTNDPPKPAAPPQTRRHRIVIDSRSRDRSAHPSPAKYEVLLQNDLYNVTSMQLAVADVPFPAYLVGPARRGVPFSVAGGATLTAVLPAGDYADPADMASELESALNAAAAAAGASTAPPSAFVVRWLARTDSFELCASAPFTLPLAGRDSDTPAAVLGFGTDADYASQPATPGPHVLRAPFRRNFVPDRYLVLKLSPNAELLTSPSQAIDRTFALLPVTPVMSVNVDDEAFTKRWNPPLARVARIALEFTDAEGNAYDFQNQNHHVELIFETCANRGGQP
jgi:hypothetical protein